MSWSPVSNGFSNRLRRGFRQGQSAGRVNGKLLLDDDRISGKIKVTVRRGTVPIFAAQRAFFPNDPPFPPQNGTVPFAFSGENCLRRPVNGYN